MSFIQQIRSELYTQRYVVGFLHENELSLPNDERFSKIRWINPLKHKQGWFADPFILSADDRTIELLVEEYLWTAKRGRLAKLTIDAHIFQIKKIKTILELPTHLSFPIYIEEGGEIYVYPENYQSGKLNLYRYDRQEEQLVDPITLIEEPLLDTQIIRIDSYYFAFGIKYKTGRQDDTNTLYVYRADQLTGPYQHVQTIQANKNIKRGAGMIYLENDHRLIRPSQDCQVEYGEATILNHLEYDSQTGQFSEKAIEDIRPDNSHRYGRGLHTLNCKNGICVIDGRGFRHGISHFIKRHLLR